MSRRTNIVNSVLTIIITVGLVFLTALMGNEKNSDYSIGLVIVLLLAGALLAGLLNTLFHELMHVLVGKKNNFAFISMFVWFIKIEKIKDKLQFKFELMGDAGGYSEMVPKNLDNLGKRFSKMTGAGLIANFVLMILGIIPFVIPNIPLPIFFIFGMFLPISAYCLLSNGLPVSNYGARNDGGVIYGLKHKDDDSKVILSLISIQSELLNGKTPSNIDEKLYFDVPQLQEDCINFTLINNARYEYYLDKGDYDNAKKVMDRLLSVQDYMPKQIKNEILTEALYASCTFDYNQDKADEYMYELEKYLNSINTFSTVRAKLAYIYKIKGEKDCFDIFYKKGIKEAKKCPLKGLGTFNMKLLDEIK